MRNMGFKILIIDDSSFNHTVLRNILVGGGKASAGAAGAVGAAGNNYIVDVAKSGLEGLEKTWSFQPDLILLDIIMPGMSGFEVLTRLKESAVTRSIPVIVITGLSDAENEEKGFILGAVDYIAKPFKEPIVLARIKTHQTIVEQMHTIEHQSLFDPLTNVMNRRSFDFHSEALWAHAIRQQESISVLMIDIDNFKCFNDTYGHQLGDIALKITADAIAVPLKRASDLLFRWGGEEFIVLLPNTLIDGAVYIAEQIRENIESAEIPSTCGVTPPGITASVGVASILPSVGSAMSDTIRQADNAMYTAKESGRNRVCF